MYIYIYVVILTCKAVRSIPNVDREGLFTSAHILFAFSVRHQRTFIRRIAHQTDRWKFNKL